MTLDDMLKEPENMIEGLFGSILYGEPRMLINKFKTKKHNCIQLKDKYMGLAEPEFYLVWYALTNSQKNVVVGAPKDTSVKSFFSTIKSYINFAVMRINEIKENYISVIAEGPDFIVLSNNVCISCGTLLDGCICSRPYDLILYIGLDLMTDEQFAQFTKCYLPIILGNPETKIIFVYEKNNREIFDKLT